MASGRCCGSWVTNTSPSQHFLPHLAMERRHFRNALSGQKFVRLFDDNHDGCGRFPPINRLLIGGFLRLLNPTQQVTDNQDVDDGGVAIGEINDGDPPSGEHLRVGQFTCGLIVERVESFDSADFALQFAPGRNGFYAVIKQTGDVGGTIAKL